MHLQDSLWSHNWRIQSCYRLHLSHPILFESQSHIFQQQSPWPWQEKHKCFLDESTLTITSGPNVPSSTGSDLSCMQGWAWCLPQYCCSNCNTLHTWDKWQSATQSNWNMLVKINTWWSSKIIATWRRAHSCQGGIVSCMWWRRIGRCQLSIVELKQFLPLPGWARYSIPNWQVRGSYGCMWLEVSSSIWFTHDWQVERVDSTMSM